MRNAEDYRWNEQSDIDNGRLTKDSYSDRVWEKLCEAFGVDGKETIIVFDPDVYNVRRLLTDIERDAWEEEKQEYTEDDMWEDVKEEIGMHMERE